MIWVMGGFIAFTIAILAIPTEILGGIVLFALCVWGITSGPWWVVIPCVLLLIGLAANIFGE